MGAAPEDPDDSSSSSSDSDDGEDEDNDHVYDTPEPKRQSSRRVSFGGVPMVRTSRAPRGSREKTPFGGAYLFHGGAPVISMSKPEKFSGKDKSKFTAWWLSVKDYMDIHDMSFANERAKIAWIGALYTDVALQWHQARAAHTARFKYVDNWDGYVQALTERFTDPAK